MEKVANYKARLLVQELKEFKGSNTFSERTENCYTVYSYGKHFPLFVCIGYKWYENKDRNSVSTSKHRSQLHPHVETEKCTTSFLKNLINS